MFTHKFNEDFSQWRKTRNEYKALLKAIRQGKPFAELQDLMADAGVGTNECSELRTLHLRASAADVSHRASQCEQAEQVIADLTARIKALDKRADVAKTHGEYDRAVAEIHELTEQLQRAQSVAGDYRVARQTRDAAVAAGLA